MYKLGLVSVSFRQNSPSEIIYAVKQAGLTCIEWGSDVHAPNDDLTKIRNIRKECEKNGIDCCSYGTYFRIGKNKVDEIYSYISAAKELGTNILRLWCGTKSFSKYNNDEKLQFISECQALERIAKKENVILCMECHNNTFTESKEGAQMLIESVFSENFKMYWQPNQYRTDKENIQYAKMIENYTEIIHVFNWDGDNKYPLIEAKELWQKYLNQFSKNKTLLLEFMPDNKIESLAGEVNALKEIVGERI